MSYNPLAPQLADAQAALARLRNTRAALDEELRWHARFDLEAYLAELRTVTERHAGLLATLDDTRSRVQEAERELRERREDAAMGWNPARWFSAERNAAKQRHAELEAALARLHDRRGEAENQLGEADRRKSHLESELRRHAAVDAALGRERLAQLDRDIAAQEPKVADLARRKERVDVRLTPLLSQLHDREREAIRLDRVLEVAESFQHELDWADNGYERKLVHDQCEEEFGRSSPGAVIREARHQSRALDRDLDKLRRRIAEEARRSARDVRAVVIDGNNLCYDGKEFIGLTALMPVVEVLSRAHDVTVVFDRSISTRWRFSDNELTSSLPGARVHVVRSPRAADELVLDVASDPYAVVLSNDRFGEFQDKDAVRDGRIVRHDILKGRVSVPDLEVSEPLVALR